MKNSIKIEKTLLNKLKVKHFSLLTEIDRFQNVLKASKELNMRQPAASKMLQEIEDILGVTLFERGRRGVETTPYGEILVAQAKQVLSAVRHASEEIVSLKDGVSGHVRIGTLLAAAPVLLPSAVTSLKSTHPEVLVSIQDGTNESLIAALDNGDIDLAISRMQPSLIQKGLLHEVLYEDHMCVVSRTGHPGAESNNIAVKELAECQWILPGPQTLLRDQFNQVFSSAGVKPPSDKVVESVSLHMNLALLLQTDMVTFLPYHAAKPYIDLGLLKQLNTRINSKYGPIGVSYKQQESLTPASRIMLEYLRKEAEKLS
ncbi:MAG: LysR family transcriptional regulator [Gammaproteobacteria bacterium]|nr:LysR family transcriptional regulator [Gammaproteobacteria bacterium]